MVWLIQLEILYVLHKMLLVVFVALGYSVSCYKLHRESSESLPHTILFPLHCMFPLGIFRNTTSLHFSDAFRLRSSGDILHRCCPVRFWASMLEHFIVVLKFTCNVRTFLTLWAFFSSLALLCGFNSRQFQLLITKSHTWWYKIYSKWSYIQHAA